MSLGAWVIASGPLGWDWGTVPAWISTASVLLAAVSYWHSVRDKKREQASKIAAWVDSSYGWTLEKKFVLRVRNNSNTPVFNVSIEDYGELLPELAPDASFDKEVSPSASHLKDEEGFYRALESYASGTGLRGRIGSVRSARRLSRSREQAVEIRFRDALGRWWRRTPGGKIRRIRKPSNEEYALLLMETFARWVKSGPKAKG